MDGPRILADAGPTQVGAALSMEACADGAHSWTLRRLSNGGSGISDYLGVCIGAACICLSATPTSGSFNGFVVGFRATANVGGDLRYKNSGSLLQQWQALFGEHIHTHISIHICACSIFVRDAARHGRDPSTVEPTHTNTCSVAV